MGRFYLKHSSHRSWTDDFAVKRRRLSHLTNEPNKARPSGIEPEKHGFGDHVTAIGTGVYGQGWIQTKRSSWEPA